MSVFKLLGIDIIFLAVSNISFSCIILPREVLLNISLITKLRGTSVLFNKPYGAHQDVASPILPDSSIFKFSSNYI